MSTDLAPPTTERDSVEAWREYVLLLAGFDAKLARRIALHCELGSDYIDLHAAIELVEQGCSPATAERILRP